VFGLAISIAKGRLMKKGKRLRIYVNQDVCILRVTKQNNADRDNPERTVAEFVRGLSRIAQTWLKIRHAAGELIEMFIDSPRYVVNRLLHIFEALDMLIGILGKIEEKREK